MKKALAIAALAAVPSILFARPAAAQTVATISSLYPSTPAGYCNISTATVTGILNTSAAATNIVVSDGSNASAIIYRVPTATYTPTVGDTISFEAYNSPYQGAPELTNSSSGIFTLVGTPIPGTAPTPPVISIPTFVASGNGTSASNPPYAEAIVTLDNVSFTTSPSTLATNTTYTLVDKNGATTHLYGYASDSNVAASVTAADALNPTGFGGTYNITGYVDEYYGVPEIYPLSITTVSGSQVPEPASLGLLALGGGAMLARRRRHA